MIEKYFGKRLCRSENPAFVMGIVNATPDSFFEKSRGGIERAYKLLEEGADIIDIGGESTRPGFSQITAEEELKRVLPIVQELRRHTDAVISIDTRHSLVMKAAAQEGADILNDVSALEDDEQMASFAASQDFSVILMHRYFDDLQKFSETQKSSLKQRNATDDVINYLKQRTDFAIKVGIDSSRIIWDPGIGFGKTFSENVNLIKNLRSLTKEGYPVLMALSRKRCIGQMTGTEENMKPTEDRLYGTLAADIISILNGAEIIRVHDVKETVDTLKVMKYTV